ncbi:Probable WRKY transcription factor 14 [Striga hermonthica]|uniref:Probable WRKY transcription factor 14 n=1 Tax=Striga hermonthica TaxID=68872 RepID=A0A9N7NDG2_STRHE|nr:Probable WRKY transcription factor 14 [Striga hermonthica]
MENNNNNYQGDLTDVIRAAAVAAPTEQWQFPATPPLDVYPSEPGRDDFGDPFTHLGDPLLHGSETRVGSGFFHGGGNTVGFAPAAAAVITSNDMMGQRDVNLDDEMRRPNYFSRMLQISPSGETPPCGSPPAAAVNRRNSLISPSISKNYPPAGLQISSPRNTGIRRRKSQVKKVVCIPAPTPANSRPSGEIVPSDLWAWRKYGQKPIKGSPYPRGYYRCSSSKGCSARKQVERSRTDPNMLVITYTSEHNHPWPTQRNALAGSTRSQSSKTNNTNVVPKSPDKSQAPQKPTDQKETLPVKEEMGLDPVRMETNGLDFDTEFPGPSQLAEDNFFADLGEIETNSLGIFGFSGGDGSDNKGLDPFSFYDWAGSSNGDSSSHGEANKNDS